MKAIIGNKRGPGQWILRHLCINSCHHSQEAGTAQTRHVCWLLIREEVLKGKWKAKEALWTSFKKTGEPGKVGGGGGGDRVGGGVGGKGGGWFYYIVNMGNSVTVLAAYQSTWLVKILSVTRVIWCLQYGEFSDSFSCLPIYLAG